MFGLHSIAKLVCAIAVCGPQALWTPPMPAMGKALMVYSPLPSTALVVYSPPPSTALVVYSRPSSTALLRIEPSEPMCGPSVWTQLLALGVWMFIMALLKFTVDAVVENYWDHVRHDFRRYPCLVCRVYALVVFMIPMDFVSVLVWPALRFVLYRTVVPRYGKYLFGVTLKAKQCIAPLDYPNACVFWHEIFILEHPRSLVLERGHLYEYDLILCEDMHAEPWKLNIGFGLTVILVRYVYVARYRSAPVVAPVISVNVNVHLHRTHPFNNRRRAM